MTKLQKVIRRSPLRRISSKRSTGKALYKKAYEEQDRQMMDEFGYIFCVSCGLTVSVFSGSLLKCWGHSHNIPVGQRPDLEADPENFRPRCQNFILNKGCHEKLDNHDFQAIKDFKDLPQIMEYRKKHDRHAYNTFVQGLISVGCKDYDYLD